MEIKKTATGGRIIPARAGFTPTRWTALRACPDHPRSRGVYTFTDTLGEGMRGSSPLARGLRVRRLPRHGPCRIIPARAGFTSQMAVREADVGDHPRSRGVYGSRHDEDDEGLGSSPLARGLHCCVGDHIDRVRIIPARAGFTLGAASRWVEQGGSSPLARGLQTEVVVRRIGRGIIPARAGFTVPALDAA